ncbi:MAG: sigma-70 family RNA polymerase sigma factor [Planctomycetes bacterium]|nr:sigma-70 family RNA polymerase sigma factor [Planctomycetota bacterium]
MSGMDDATLLASVHAQLKVLARRQMAAERRNHTLQATALVHEAWLALRDRLDTVRDEPRRFYAAAAEAMRRILIDHARKRGTEKRGGRLERLPLDVVEVAATASLDEVLAVDEAVQALAEAAPRAAEVVRLRFYAGLDEQQVADVLGLTTRTVRRDWSFARAWLYRRLAAQA